MSQGGTAGSDFYAGPNEGRPLGPPRAAWREALSVIGCLFLGGVFLYASYAKLIDPVRFAEHIELEELHEYLGAMPTALLAIGLEVFVGVGLMLLVRRWWVILPTTGLVAFFLFLTGRNWYRDAHGEELKTHGCGCFGNLVDRTPQEAFLQDLALMVPALLLIWLAFPSRGSQPWGRGLLAILLAGGAAFFATKAPDVEWLDDLATRINVGNKLEEVCQGSGTDEICLSQLKTPAPLSEGLHLIILGDVTQEGWRNDQLPALEDAMAAWYDLPEDEVEADLQVWLLTPGEDEQIRSFRDEYEPEFGLIPGPQSLLRALYRRLPRSIMVHNGVVIRTQDGLMPPARWRP